MPETPTIDRGVYKIKCVKDGGITLTNYGQYEFDKNDEIDLLDPELPDTIKCLDWHTADNMCLDTGFEIAQRIAAGEFTVTEKRMPDMMQMRHTRP